jgi:hypothetical protein
MDELKVIREAIEDAAECNLSSGEAAIALEALARLEAVAFEFKSADEVARDIVCTHYLDSEISEASASISRYAYRYSEDIRKERDEWKALATKFRDAVNEMGAV